MFSVLKTPVKKEAINSKKGGYIYNEKDNINLFLYIELTPEELKEVLPKTYNNNLKDSNYLAIIIYNEKDYLNQASFNSIKQFIINKNMENIFEKDYNNLHKKINNLTIEQYNNYIGFAKEQLY